MWSNTEKLGFRFPSSGPTGEQPVSQPESTLVQSRKMIFRWCRNASLLLLLLLGTQSIWGQVTNSNISPKINSPLSRFGLGDANPQYFIANAGMAGLSTAWNDPYHLNIENPASLAYLKATAFTAGIYAKRSNFEAQELGGNNWSGNLQYLALGFPLRNPINQALDRQSNEWNAGMSIALLPFTQVGYDILLIDSLSQGVDLSTNSLKGSGGTSRLRWGTGFRYKQLSVGVDVGFLFGKIINSRRVDFDSLENALSTEFQDELSFRGTTWKFGAQYTYDFKETREGTEESTGKSIILGASLSNETGYNLEGTQFTRRFLTGVVSDTIFRDATITGNGVLPAAFSVGVHYRDINRLNIGLEYGVANWSNYTNTLKPDQLADTYYLAIGGEYTPKYNSYNNYLERVRYRLGFRTGSDPRTLGGQQVEGYSATLGFGLPVVLPRQQVSFVNLAVELGRTGVEGVLEENFVRLSLGFTLNDNSWFFKRKFN